MGYMVGSQFSVVYGAPGIEPNAQLIGKCIVYSATTAQKMDVLVSFDVLLAVLVFFKHYPADEMVETVMEK